MTREGTRALDDPADALWQRAQNAIAAKQAGPARAALEALLAGDPAHVWGRLALVDLSLRQDRVREATAHALEAVRTTPPYPELIADVVARLLQVGETVAARELLQHPALASVKSDLLLLRLAEHWHSLGQTHDALAALDRAELLGFDGDQVRFKRGQQLTHLGRFEEAEPELELSLALSPTSGRTAIALARLRTQTRDRNHFSKIATGLKNVKHGTRDHAALEFALYKELEDVGRHDEAWDALQRGNAAMHARKRHDAARQRAFTDRQIAACTAEALRPVESARSGPQPVFILGFPRSGTTLLERMLGNHSQVRSAGELRDFGHQLHWCTDHRTTQDEVFLSRLPALDFAELGRRYLAQTQWRAQDKPFFTDKQPTNWMVAGIICAALPEARILHMVRDPMDVCFSNYRAFFGDSYAYSYDLASLASQYLDYRRLLAHWHALMPGRILDVPYATLAREPEATLGTVLAFCGLEWEDGCTDIRRNQTPAATLSAAQVRDAVRTDAFGGWRPYARHLAGLRKALDTALGGAGA